MRFVRNFFCLILIFPYILLVINVVMVNISLFVPTSRLTGYQFEPIELSILEVKALLFRDEKAAYAVYKIFRETNDTKLEAVYWLNYAASLGSEDAHQRQTLCYGNS
ncbi:hypothetical protein [Thiolinea disciformis]|uniref:hypothetical protein n=1 Tax=Thiolinea disciformis TaxID=125614 RepID=UPI00035E3E1F|nr:hypothetical protein [Thiolinea disciformis]